MATLVVVFKILFLILITHSFIAQQQSQAARNVPPVQSEPSGKQANSVISTTALEEPQHFQEPNNGERKTEVILEDFIYSRRRRQSGDSPANKPEQALPIEEEPPVSSSQATNSSAEQADTSAPGEPEEPSQRRRSDEAQAAQVNYAELCYLSNGGSSITLTVNEATQVGSIIGTVEVNGEPSLDGGNVDLWDESTSPFGQRQPPGGDSPSLAPSQSNTGDQTTTTTGHPIQQIGGKQRRVHYRRSPEAATSGAPPQSGQMLGLVSDYQSAGSGHSASFYSLVASTSPPVAAGSPSSPIQPIQPTQAQQPPVKLIAGTRNLVLVRQLDKESPEGEQSLVINVRCSPRGPPPDKQVAAGEAPEAKGKLAAANRQLESTTIPVRIIITDANDHAPEFVGQLPYVVNISETAPIGSVVSRDILAQDRDSAGPFSTLHYRVLDDDDADTNSNSNAHSRLLQFANPLESTLIIAGQLDYESLPSFTITILVQDEGEPEPLSGRAQVQVNVIDFDDQNPRFLDDKYTLVMDETQQNLVGQNLQVLPRNLYAEDGDRGINAPILYSFDQLGGFQQPSSSLNEPATTPEIAANSATTTDIEATNIADYLHLNPTSGEIRLIRQWPSKWLGSPMTLVVRATQADNKDRYTLTTLTITRPALTGTQAGRVGAAASVQSPVVSGSEDTHLTSAGDQTQSHSAKVLEFVPNKLHFQVSESAAVNDKIARVRARYNKDGAHTGEQSPSADNQAVDLIAQDWPSNSLSAFKLHGNKTRRTRVAELQQTAAKRPINYQILDDQTDQFGINGMGEIYLKRQLDYEQRQEYKFRVLATYTKHSDLCQVQVSVLNVNDNKPKFTQPQYTFHLTESRLRTNIIGNVLAHDADLNDTVRYSLAGEHAHLFEISPSGQISLRDNIRQLNMTNCQLIAQAIDSLAPPLHTHLARINLHVAAQLVGRSINFDHNQHQQQHHHHHHQDQDAKLFNSRSLIETRASESSAGSPEWPSLFSAGGSNGRQVNLREQQPAGANQRSSVATVMSSLQHMVRSVNFFDMPFSSALLLSALLAFLICLLLIVVISMSVHLYRRRSKQRHRQHLAAAAHLRHAQMTAALQQPNEAANRSRYLQSGAASGGSGAAFRSGCGSSSGSSANSSPTNSTAAGNSPTNFQAPSQPDPPAPPQPPVTGSALLSANAAPSNRLLSPNRPIDASQPKSAEARPIASNRPSSALANRSAAGSRQSQAALRSPLMTQLSIGALSGLDARSGLLSPNKMRLTAAVKAEQADISLISSLSSQRSKRSYRSNTTDDSSVMHCGHYSVTASQSPQQHLAADNDGELQPTRRKTTTSSSRQQSIEAAIESLVRAGEETGGDSELAGSASGDRLAKQRRKSASSGPATSAAGLQSPNINELSVLTESKPGIKSYRKLARAQSRVAPEVEPLERGLVFGQTDSSAANSVAPPVSQQNQLQHQYEGLMAMIRDPDLRSSASQLSAKVGEQAACESGQRVFSPAPQSSAIKWPQGAVPNRVKKLTWDDELSVNNEDCFVAADIQQLEAANCAMSPLSVNHQYPVRAVETNNAHLAEDQYAEQHFLFSNTCSPALVSADYSSFVNGVGGGNLIGAASATGGHQPATSYRALGDGDQSSMLGQNNCFDYTIVQSSQFHVDAFASMERPASSALQPPPLPQSLSAQHHHHLLQQQQQQQQQSGPDKLLHQQRLTANYLYSNSLSNSQQRQQVAPSTNQDLTLMTTAVL